jgi:hypothetical protein
VLYFKKVSLIRHVRVKIAKSLGVSLFWDLNLLFFIRFLRLSRKINFYTNTFLRNDENHKVANRWNDDMRNLILYCYFHAAMQAENPRGNIFFKLETKPSYETQTCWIRNSVKLRDKLLSSTAFDRMFFQTLNRKRLSEAMSEANWKSCLTMKF